MTKCLLEQEKHLISPKIKNLANNAIPCEGDMVSSAMPLPLQESIVANIRKFFVFKLSSNFNSNPQNVYVYSIKLLTLIETISKRLMRKSSI